MTRFRFRPSLDRLESRLTPAGNVTAQVVNGSLIAAGDAADNSVVLTQTAPGQFTVTGADGTTVNGKTAAVTLTGVRNDVRVSLGAGADTLQIGTSSKSTIVVPRSLEIDGGSGDNTIDGRAGLTVGRDLRVTNRAGNDNTTFVGRLAVAGDVAIDNGNGDETTELNPDDGLGVNTIGGRFTVVNGAGTHVNRAVDTNVGRSVVFDNGPSGDDGGLTLNALFTEDSAARLKVGGDIVFLSRGGSQFVWDTVGNTEVTRDVVFESRGTGPSSNSVYAYEQYATVTVGGNVFVDSHRSAGGVNVNLGGGGVGSTPGLAIRGFLAVATGGGDDTLSLDAISVRRATAAYLDGGDDLVFVNGSTFDGAFVLATGSGADVVRIGERSPGVGGTAFRSAVAVALGGGDDQLFLGSDTGSGVTLTGKAVFDGGAGSDRLAVRPTVTPPRTFFVRFELFGPEAA